MTDPLHHVETIIWDNIDYNVYDNVWHNIIDNIELDNVEDNVYDNIWRNVGSRVGHSIRHFAKRALI